MPNKTGKKDLRVKIFSTFEDENRSEHRRLASLTPEQRWDEFAVLQKRFWGTRWTKDRIVKTASVEQLTW